MCVYLDILLLLLVKCTLLLQTCSFCKLGQCIGYLYFDPLKALSIMVSLGLKIWVKGLINFIVYYKTSLLGWP